jgi:hypothetical protein
MSQDNGVKFDPQSMDAVVWAKEFMRIYWENNPQLYYITEDLMLTWFANAIMAGYDEAHRRIKTKLLGMVGEKEDCQEGEQYWMWNSLHNVFDYGKKIGKNQYRSQMIAKIEEKFK